MDNILPIFKSHYSLGKSIFTLDDPVDKKGNPVESSIFSVLKQNNMDSLFLVDDSVSGLLEASENSFKNKIKLTFGLRLWITDDVLIKEDGYKKHQAKYVIVCKNLDGYKNLIQISSFAAKDGFYYEPRIDFKTLSSMWSEKNLKLVVPFYDSFLFLNNLEGASHVPQYNFTKPYFLTENNNLPFDSYMERKVEKFAEENSRPVIKSQTIYYKHKDDFVAYMAVRCLNKRTTLNKPELSHMGSDEFSFEKWKAINNKI